MLVTGLVLDFRELCFDRLGRRILHRGVERRVNEKPAGIDLLRREQQVQIALDGVHRVVLLDERHPFRMRRDLRELGFLRLRRVDLFQLDQPIQHSVALRRRAFRIS